MKIKSFIDPSLFIKIFLPVGIFLNTRFLLLNIFELIPQSNKTIFWDLNIYQIAANIQSNGGNAYLDLTSLRFVYPPYILFFFSWLGENLTLFFYVFYCISIVLFALSKTGKDMIIFSLISSALFYNFFFTFSFLTGNLTIYIHLLLILIASSQYKYKSEILIIATLLVSLIKPYFAAYILFIFLNPWTLKKKLSYMLFFCSLLMIILISQLFIYSDLSKDFIFSLKTQVLGNSEGIGADIGLAPYKLFEKIFRNKAIGLLSHFGFILVSFNIIFKQVRFLKRYLNKAEYKKITFYLFLILITIINPRMKVYDYWIIVASSTSIIFSFYKLFSYKQRYFSIPLISLTLLIIGTGKLLEIQGFKLIPNFYNLLTIYLPTLLSLVILPRLFAKNIQKRLEV